MNIQIMNGYNVTKIVTACPHCFNTLKNEYPQLGCDYESCASQHVVATIDK